MAKMLVRAFESGQHLLQAAQVFLDRQIVANTAVLTPDRRDVPLDRIRGAIFSIVDGRTVKILATFHLALQLFEYPAIGFLALKYPGRLPQKLVQRIARHLAETRIRVNDRITRL